MKEHLCSQCEKPFSTKPMLTIHLMEAHEFNPIESVSYKSELADALSNDTSAAQALSLKSMQVVEDTNLKGQNYFISRIVKPNFENGPLPFKHSNCQEINEVHMVRDHPFKMSANFRDF